MWFCTTGSEERMQTWEGNALLPGFLFSKRIAWIPVMPIPHILWEPATCAASLGAVTPCCCCFKTEKQLICRIFPAQDIVYVILQIPTEPTNKLCRVFKISAKPYYAVIFSNQNINLGQKQNLSHTQKLDTSDTMWKCSYLYFAVVQNSSIIEKCSHFKTQHNPIFQLSEVQSLLFFSIYLLHNILRPANPCCLFIFLH